MDGPDAAAILQVTLQAIHGTITINTTVPGGIVIPAGATVELKPRSLHVMFMELKEAPEEGRVFPATLTFEKAGRVEVDFEVLAPNAHMN